MLKSLVKNPLNISVVKNLNLANILLVRHAESEFNNSISLLENKALHSNLPKNQFKIMQKTISGNKQYIDSPITEKGINQCHKASLEIKDLNIKYVFVSPLKRCLETCRIILENKIKNDLINTDQTNISNNGHLNLKDIMKEKKIDIKIVVHPYLFEKIEDSCDLIGDIYKNRDEYNYFDWSLFNNFGFEKSNIIYYQSKFCDNVYNDNNNNDVIPKQKNLEIGNITDFNSNYYFNAIKDELLKNNIIESEQIKEIYHEYLINEINKLYDNDVYLESSFQTIERLNYLKEFLLDFMDVKKINCDSLIENNINSEKILLVGHSVLFKHLTSKFLTEDSLNPGPNEYKLNNCEFMGVKIHI